MDTTEHTIMQERVERALARVAEHYADCKAAPVTTEQRANGPYTSIPEEVGQTLSDAFVSLFGQRSLEDLPPHIMMMIHPAMVSRMVGVENSPFDSGILALVARSLAERTMVHEKPIMDKLEALRHELEPDVIKAERKRQEQRRASMRDNPMALIEALMNPHRH